MQPAPYAQRSLCAAVLLACAPADRPIRAPSAPAPSAPAPVAALAPVPAAPRLEGRHGFRFITGMLSHDMSSATMWDETGELELELGPAGAVRLALHSECALERWENLARAREVQRMRAEWHGDALPAGDGVRMVLRLSAAHCTVAPEGEAEVVAECLGLGPEGSLLAMHCAPGRVRVRLAPLTLLPVRGDEASVHSPALRCVPEQPLPHAFIRITVDEMLYFPTQSGLQYRWAANPDGEAAGFEPLARD
jgi:hypothetical protein